MPRLVPSELRISVRRSSGLPTDPAEEIFHLPTTDVGGDVSGDAITDALFEIVNATDLRDGITITESRHLTAWGASGGEWEYLVEVASMLDEAVILIAVEKAFNKIAAIIGGRGEPILDRDQALSFAKTSILIQNPSLQHDQLVLVSEENDHEANRWSFGFRPGDGWEYVAEVGWQGRLPSLTRVRRLRIEDV